MYIAATKRAAFFYVMLNLWLRLNHISDFKRVSEVKNYIKLKKALDK